MNKKIIAGTVIALAAGIATFLYKKNRNRIHALATETDKAAKEALHFGEEKAERLYS